MENRSFLNGTLSEYLALAASDAPTPGGGSVAAVAGALGAAMAEMSARFTLGRKKYADVAAEMEAMIAVFGAARAALFPTLSLTASIGTGSTELDRLFNGSNSTWSFVPLLRLPIFDSGRNRAAVQIAESNQRIAVAQYEQAVQTAFRETADVLADRAQWNERLAAQTAMVEHTQKAFDLSEARFKSGVDDYLTVLDAQRSLYAAQQTLIDLRLSEQINRVTLWKVLGGEESATGQEIARQPAR